MADRAYDIVLFGATGFTGALTAEYLTAAVPNTQLRWAVAGRDRAKLMRLKERLLDIDERASAIGVIEADVTDSGALAAMARQAHVVVSTVGPYTRYGEPVVRACVEEGADYADLTGEPAFVSSIRSLYDEIARERSLRIVNSCGFDSIPADLGVYYTVKQLGLAAGAENAGKPIAIEGFVKSRGTFSGGTWQSALLAFSQLGKQAKSARPRPDGSARKVRPGRPRPGYRKELGAWALPLPTIDPVMVLRSARAYDFYGDDFTYNHYLEIRQVHKAAGLLAGLGTVVALAQLPPARRMLEKVRAPGEGPSAEVRAKGWFRVTFLAEQGSAHLRTEVRGGDPGYTETARMLGETALCLAADRERLPKNYGVVTPAMAMGDALLERIQKAGIVFTTLASS